MCIAAYKPENMVLSEETLRNCWDGNPDGAGFMYAEEGKIVIVKGLMTFKDFMEAYEPHKLKQCALHFRIATHGNVDKENTHPFRVSETLGLVHNGIINNIACDINKDMSDTWHFTEKIMKPFEQHWQSPAYKALVESFIGYSKLILLDGEGNFSIYGEKHGTWDCQCWFSNTSYKVKKTVYVPPKTTGNAWSRKAWQLGDLATTDWKDKGTLSSGLIKDIPKGTLVKVEAFGHGAFVWVICLDKEVAGCRFKINGYGLNPYEEKPSCSFVQDIWDDFALDQEVVFSQNYNHFRIGDKGIVTSVANTNLLITDPKVMSNKHYLVPKTHVKPALLLLN